VPAPPASDRGAWPWWLIGLALAVVAGVVLWRRALARPVETIAQAPEPAAPLPAPTPSPPARPVAPARQPDHALVLDFRPQRLWTRGPDAHVAFELVVTNTSDAAIDGIRPVIALASAGPDTAADIATFSARSQTLPSSEPFSLRSGESRGLAGELTLAGDAMYVTSAADRELIVPLALVALHWRMGLSVARATQAFIIGTGDASAARLGPIWVDRAGLVYTRLDARRFTPGPG
jgi:hypothetical protein